MPARVPSAPHRSSHAPSPACACGRLRRAARALTQLYDEAMAPADVRVTQYSLLRRLEEDGPTRISVLAGKLLLDRTALSRNLDPLVARGLVAVSAGRDARTREVRLTARGAQALLAATPYWQAAQHSVARRIGPERLQLLVGILGELETLHPDRDPSSSASNPT